MDTDPLNLDNPIRDKKQRKKTCVKCGMSTVEEPNLVLYRFPRPGRFNTRRAQEWAQFAYPAENWASIDFQMQLHNQRKWLCTNHFSESSFTDYATKKLHPYSSPSINPDHEQPSTSMMVNQNTDGAAEPQAMAGPNGETLKGKQSSCSSSSSSTSSLDGRRGKRRHCRKKRKRSQYSNQSIDKIFKAVSELRTLVTTGNTKTLTHSGDLYEHHKLVDETPYPGDECQNSNPDFTFDIETKLKKPAVPKTSNSFLKMLTDVQRLGNSSWSEVRYAETQKSYNHTPGFVDLETNKEVKNYETLRHLAHTDKSYAAITYCILKQKESLQENILNLLSWARNTEVNFESLNSKVEELFLKGNLPKITSDLLQLVCGHRAETIKMRRESITSQVRDPLVKASLNRIPPTATNLFDSEPFTSILEKAGGVRKAFFPPKTDSLSQIKPNQLVHHPSREPGTRQASVPSHGTQYFFNEPGVQLLPTAIHPRGVVINMSTVPPDVNP